MPIPKRTIRGKVDYQVEQQISDLTDGLNALERDKGAGAAAAALATGVETVGTQVRDALAQIALLRNQQRASVLVINSAGAIGGSGSSSNPIIVNVDGTTIIINENNQLEVVNVTNVAGAGGGHLHGLMRTLGDGAEDTFDLDDIAEYLEHVAVNGAIVDPTTFSLSTDGTQIVFDTPPGAGDVIALEYVIAGL